MPRFFFLDILGRAKFHGITSINFGWVEVLFFWRISFWNDIYNSSPLLLQINKYRYAAKLLPGLCLGHAVGRIGCFLAGCCFGKQLHPPLKIEP